MSVCVKHHPGRAGLKNPKPGVNYFEFAYNLPEVHDPRKRRHKRRAVSESSAGSPSANTSFNHDENISDI